MTLLRPLTEQPSHLRALFEGFGKTGKTRTALELAIGTVRHFDTRPVIAVFDTEGSSPYLARRLKGAGIELLVVRSESFDDLIETIDECVQGRIEVLIIDQLSHVWDALVQSYLAEVNRQRGDASWEPREDLEPRDWTILRGRWRRFVELYQRAPVHFIACARAWHEWGHESDERGRRQLVKTGTKLQGEARFVFEASLVVEMDSEVVRVQGQDASAVRRRATVIGDRFGVIDGRTAVDPTFEFFEPHVAQLVPTAYEEREIRSGSSWMIDETGHGAYTAHRRRAVILWEEIDGWLHKHYPGSGPVDRAGRRDLLLVAFGTTSPTKVQGMTLSELQKGLADIQAFEPDLDAQLELETNRKVLWEEVEGELVRRFPSTSAKDKAGRRELLERAFKTTSQTKVQGLPVEKLEAGLTYLREDAARSTAAA